MRTQLQDRTEWLPIALQGGWAGAPGGVLWKLNCFSIKFLAHALAYEAVLNQLILSLFISKLAV